MLLCIVESFGKLFDHLHRVIDQVEDNYATISSTPNIKVVCL